MASAASSKGAAIIAALLLASSTAWAFEPENRVGEKQEKAHEKLAKQGYSLVKTNQKNNRTREFGWNASKNKCALLSIDLKCKVES